MMEAEMDAMPSEISPSLMMKSSSSGGRKFSISEPKVILRSLFPETWLFDLFDIGEMPLRFLALAVTAFVRQFLSLLHQPSSPRHPSRCQIVLFVPLESFLYRLLCMASNRLHGNFSGVFNACKLY